MNPKRSKRVSVIAFDGVPAFELGIAVEVFGLQRKGFDHWYECRVAGLEQGPLRTTGGMTVQAPVGLGGLDRAGTIVLPAWRNIRERAPEVLLRKLRNAHARGAKLVSICSGAFVLAQAGLLDGRRATTHWMYADELGRRFPKIKVDPNVLYVDQGRILTSAGSAAGIDACLHVVRKDFGATVANRLARRLVVPAHRAGGQSQFIDRPVAQDEHTNGLSELLDEIRGSLDEEHTVASMARRACLSERTFARRFRKVTGTTPHKWLVRERVLHAQSLLESSDLGIDRIAEVCGFSDAQLLRLHFKRMTGTPPSAYRQTFRRTGTTHSTKTRTRAARARP